MNVIVCLEEVVVNHQLQICKTPEINECQEELKQARVLFNDRSTMSAHCLKKEKAGREIVLAAII